MATVVGSFQGLIVAMILVMTRPLLSSSQTALFLVFHAVAALVHECPPQVLVLEGRSIAPLVEAVSCVLFGIPQRVAVWVALVCSALLGCPPASRMHHPGSATTPSSPLAPPPPALLLLGYL